MKIFIINTAIVVICFSFKLKAQDYFFTSNTGQFINEKYLYFNGLNTSVRPFTGSENTIIDSLIFQSYTKHEEKSLFTRKLLHEHLYHKKNEQHEIVINPIFDFRLNNNQINNQSGFLNTRGVTMFGRLDSRVWFNTAIYENQGSFPQHIDELYNSYYIIPGYSRIKLFGDNDEAYDFMTAYGSVSVKPTDNLFFTFGTDKNFIGDGYRSMLLSDFTCSYLNFRTSYSIGNISFNHIIGHHLNPNYNNIMGVNENWSFNMAYPGKFISYNYLNWHINNKIQLGFFEATVFDARDEDNIWNYAALNPLPYLNTAIYGFDDTNNVLAGLNFSYQDKKYGVAYAQFLIDKISFSSDDDYSNRFAWQAGYKSFDFIGIDELYIQLEYNHADVLTYTHKTPEQHYGHFSQALAHPAGSGFDELVFIVKYTYNRLAAMSKLNYIQYKYGGSFDFKNIFNQQSFFDASTIVTPGNTIVYFDTQLIYYINKAIGLQAFAGVVLRRDLLTDYDNVFTQFGMRTALRSNYYDF